MPKKNKVTPEQINEAIEHLESASEIVWQYAYTYELSQMGSDIDDMIKELKKFHPTITPTQK